MLLNLTLKYTSYGDLRKVNSTLCCIQKRNISGSIALLIRTILTLSVILQCNNS